MVVVSSSAFSSRYGDVVGLALSSYQQEDTALALEDWQVAGLVKPTWIKPLVATLASTAVDRRLGSLSKQDRKRVGDALRAIFAPEFLTIRENDMAV
jgi:mRNA interferase MazF